MSEADSAPTVKLLFIERGLVNRGHETVVMFEKGEIAEVSEASADRWKGLGVAVDAPETADDNPDAEKLSEPYNLVKVKFGRFDVLDANGTKLNETSLADEAAAAAFIEEHKAKAAAAGGTSDGQQQTA